MIKQKLYLTAAFMLLVSIASFSQERQLSLSEAWEAALAGYPGLTEKQAVIRESKAGGEHTAPPALFRSANGELTDIANSKDKVIFLNFWAEWCPPCLAEMPSIGALAEQFKGEKDLLFLMANVDGELESSEAYFAKKGYPLPAFVPAGMIPKDIFEGTLPTTIIINKNGKIVYHHEGIGDYNTQETKDFIKRLLLE